MRIERFDGHAKAYTVGRPDYAEELIECLYSDYGVSASSAIADIGSGTGKFSRHLLERGSEVYFDYCPEFKGFGGGMRGAVRECKAMCIPESFYLL